MVDTDAIRAKHQPRRAVAPIGDALALDVCDACRCPWPCDAVRLCDALVVLREEITRLRAENAGLRDALDAAEQRIRIVAETARD